ncbi:uncharacterized protein LOC134243608 [Saccostrea cucullata]|uniref:uncharacterized protein LOC134243608 n=1 Tax=Saccostrea cuccullata TaxID=36930 RepID=UPI002ED3B3D0
MSDIKDEINTLEIVLDTNDLSELFSVRSNLYSYRNIPNVIVPSLPKLILEKFPEEDICRLFGALSFTSLTPDEHDNSMKTTQKSPEAGSSTPVKNILDEPETVTTKDTGYDKLNNVECLGDEEIWTRGQYDNTIKLYSINQGSLLKSITTKSGN